MRSSFFGIETMRRAILTPRRVMDTIGHNVANAATEGYSRQRVNLETTRPFPYPGVNRLWGAGQVGTGVISASIERIRDVFIDKQLRIGTTDQGRVEVEKNTLRQIENAFLEPSSEEGLQGAFAKFFDAWQELSTTISHLRSRSAISRRLRMHACLFNLVDRNPSLLRSLPPFHLLRAFPSPFAGSFWSGSST